MAYSGFTWFRVEPQNDPNSGRNKINTNFENIASMFNAISVASSTGATIVTSGTNIQVDFLGYSGGTVPIYGVSTTSDVVFNILSASTYYSGGVLLEQIIDSIASQYSAGTSFWDTSGGTIYNNNGGFVGINNSSPQRNLDVTGSFLTSYEDFSIEASDSIMLGLGMFSGVSLVSVNNNDSTLSNNGIFNLFGVDSVISCVANSNNGRFDAILTNTVVGTLIFHAKDINNLNIINGIEIGDDGVQIYGRSEGNGTNTEWINSGNTVLMRVEDQGLIQDLAPQDFVVMDSTKSLRSLPFSAVTSGAQSYTYLDYASALSMANSSGLTPGGLYVITDAAHANGATGQIFTRAISADTFDIRCTWRRPTNLKAFSILEVLDINSDVTDVLVGASNQLSSTVLFNTDTYNTVVDIANDINTNMSADVEATVLYPYSSATYPVYLILDWKTATSTPNGLSVTINSVSASTYNATNMGEGADSAEFEYSVDYDLYSNNIKRLVDAKNNFEIFNQDAISYDFRLEDSSNGGSFPFIGTSIIDSSFGSNVYLKDTCFSANTIHNNSVFQKVLFSGCSIINNNLSSAILSDSNSSGVLMSCLWSSNTLSNVYVDGWFCSQSFVVQNNIIDLKVINSYHEVFALQKNIGRRLYYESNYGVNYQQRSNTLDGLLIRGVCTGLSLQFSTLGCGIGDSNSFMYDIDISLSIIFQANIGGNGTTGQTMYCSNSSVNNFILENSVNINGFSIYGSNVNGFFITDGLNIQTANFVNSTLQNVQLYNPGYLSNFYIGDSYVSSFYAESPSLDLFQVLFSNIFDSRIDFSSGQTVLFSGAQINNCLLQNMTFDNFYTNQLALQYTDFTGSVFSGSSMISSKIVGGPSSNYTYWTINSSNIFNSFIENCNTNNSLWQSTFTGASLVQSNFTGASMTSVDFSGSKIFGSDFSDSTLSNFCMDASQIDNSSFSGANITNSSLSGNSASKVDLSSVSFQNVSWNNSVIKKFAEMASSSFSDIEFSSNIADRDFNFYSTKVLDGSANNGYPGDPVFLGRVSPKLITYFSQTDYALTNLGVSSTDVSVGYSLYYTTGLTNNFTLTPGSNDNFAVYAPIIKASGTTYNEIVLTPLSETITGTITLGLKGMIGI